MILAIDPGHTIGWAQLKHTGEVIDYGQCSYDDFPSFLTLMDKPKTIVVENFRIRPGVNFSWNEMKTIKCIGMIEYYAHLYEAKVVYQEPADYKIGLKWSGLTLPKSHADSHQFIAIAHGVFYSVHVLKNQPPVAKRMAST